MICDLETRFKQIQTRLKAIIQETEEVKQHHTTHLHLLITFLMAQLYLLLLCCVVLKHGMERMDLCILS